MGTWQTIVTRGFKKTIKIKTSSIYEFVYKNVGRVSII